ncbi:alpha/beta hydrolase [Chryseobacterium populi]|nr:alpha/beta hydrolase [Chryseobacterium populi]
MKKILNIISGFLLIIVFVISCKEKTVTLGKDISFKAYEDIRYSKDENPEQRMDLYIPENSVNTKPDVFIMIHGGGWRGGDKSELTFFTLCMMDKFPNAVFANIDYRLASPSRFAIPNQTNDIDEAILYLEKRLNYHPKFIVLGNSAGAHLSMLYAYHYDKTKKIKAVVNIVGPSDLSDPSFKKYTDYSFVEKHLIDPEMIQSTLPVNVLGSPAHWIDSTSAPTLSFYGTIDQIIPLSQKQTLDSFLDKNHVLNRSYEFSGGHLDWYKASNATFLIDKISGFLKKVGEK